MCRVRDGMHAWAGVVGVERVSGVVGKDFGLWGERAHQKSFAPDRGFRSPSQNPKPENPSNPSRAKTRKPENPDFVSKKILENPKTRTVFGQTWAVWKVWGVESASLGVWNGR